MIVSEQSKRAVPAIWFNDSCCIATCQTTCAMPPRAIPPRVPVTLTFPVKSHVLPVTRGIRLLREPMCLYVCLSVTGACHTMSCQP